MSASDVKKSSCGNTDNSAKSAHKYATISAVISGIGIFVVIVSLIVYVVTSRHELAATAQGYLGTMARPQTA